ncbi:MAG: hypothetical protein AAGA48_22995 [Myxococcota bacterium]
MKEPATRDPKLQRVGPALDQVARFLQRLAEQGWQRTTAVTLKEIRTVAQVAHHARLVRLQRELARLETQLKRYLDRDPSFSPAGLLGTVNRVWLLERAIRGATDRATSIADLEPIAGTPRRTYRPVEGMIDVVVGAAHGWVTDSGYVGVTAHLWHRDEKRWLQATMARPDRMVGPDPARLLRMPLSDATPLTMQEFCHGAWTLDDVRLSSDGRVSLHSELVVVPTAIAARQGLATVAAENFLAIVDRLEGAPSGPLDGTPQSLVYIEGIQIDRPLVDDTRARVFAGVRDRQGRRLEVTVPLRPEHDVLIDNLELCATPAWSPEGLIAEASLVGDQVVLSPLSAVFARPVSIGRRVKSAHLVHLTVEPLKRAKR